jgi:hypothetical protein
MRNGVNLFRAWAALALLQAALATATHAEGPPLGQAGEDRWVPSLSAIGGPTFWKMTGSSNSAILEAGSPGPELLQGPVKGNDVLVAPFVGAALELMAPALPVPTRPRFFLGAEVLPSFSSKRGLAVKGDPGCIRGPEPDAPCAQDEDGSRKVAFTEQSANGQGTKTTAEIATLAYGANLGVAFPVQLGNRQLRIRPSVAWINYKVEAGGVVSDAQCEPPNRCTDVTPIAGGPTLEGDLREITLQASASKRFNAIGPGLDIEVDTGQFGPIGSSLFLGGRAYSVLGDRTISFGDVQAYNDNVGTGMAVAAGLFDVDVAHWMYRAHVGIRFQWLGSRK